MALGDAMHGRCSRGELAAAITSKADARALGAALTEVRAVLRPRHLLGHFLDTPWTLPGHFRDIFGTLLGNCAPKVGGAARLAAVSEGAASRLLDFAGSV